jgi:hypothetical protein
MSEEIKEKDDGGLMYQQLRKFISVIVSNKFLILIRVYLNLYI